MFGLSFSELVVICVVALVAVGPQKLPGMLRTLGEWVRKLRNLTYEVRAQSGIDDILRAEGLHGGLNELRGLMRGGVQPPVYVPLAPVVAPPVVHDPYAELDVDPTKEYPPEGPDAAGTLPDDLVDDGTSELAPPPEAAAPVEATAAPLEATAAAVDPTAASAQAAASAAEAASEEKTSDEHATT